MRASCAPAPPSMNDSLRMPMGRERSRRCRMLCVSTASSSAPPRCVARICLSSLEVCGVAGYMNDSEFSVTRLLRDALAAPLMIGNDRLTATNASMLLVCTDDLE